MNAATQMMQLARSIEAGLAEQARTGRPIVMSLDELHQQLKRWADYTIVLEAQVEHAASGASLSSEYLTAIITNARWVLSNGNHAPLVRELAEAVLVLAGRTNPS
jgi:hypothetical protein